MGGSFWTSKAPEKFSILVCIWLDHPVQDTFGLIVPAVRLQVASVVLLLEETLMLSLRGPIVKEQIADCVYVCMRMCDFVCVCVSFGIREQERRKQ